MTIRKQKRRSEHSLRLFYEFIGAFWAGDIDFASALRHTHQLTAAGTAEISMIPIRQGSEEIQKRSVLCAALCYVFGAHTEDAKQQHQPAEQVKQEGPDKSSKGHAQNQTYKAHGEHGNAKAILTVAADHKITEAITDLSEHKHPPLFR